MYFTVPRTDSCSVTTLTIRAIPKVSEKTASHGTRSGNLGLPKKRETKMTILTLK